MIGYRIIPKNIFPKGLSRKQAGRQLIIIIIINYYGTCTFHDPQKCKIFQQVPK